MTDLLQWDPRKRPASAQVGCRLLRVYIWRKKTPYYPSRLDSFISMCVLMCVRVFQALRYSYFHVGQALGTPQQILEQARPQPAILPPRGPLQTQQTLQQQPLLLQPVPPSQPPPPNQHCPPSRPLQQVQPSSTAAQAAVYQRHADVVREQAKHTLKQEQSCAGPPQKLLPYIDDKSLQNKVRIVQPMWGWGETSEGNLVCSRLVLVISWPQL